MTPRILIAGIGNIFLGDDAFGVEVARQLAQRALPEGVTVADFGIRSYDLAYAIMDGYDVTILVDATRQGGAPGTAYLIEPDLSGHGNQAQHADEVVNGHSLDPVRVLRLVASLGGEPGRLYLAGCEPAVLETEGGHIGLSAPVQAAVPHAIDMILSLLEEIRQGTHTTGLAGA